MRWRLLVVATLILLLSPLPALAQHDRMHMGERLGARVFRAAPVETSARDRNAPLVSRSSEKPPASNEASQSDRAKLGERIQMLKK